MSEAPARETKPGHIPRHRGKPSPTSYEALRTEGIRLAQDLGGDIWTDYNLHDPGVTMLEALCYALTDLDYRTDFSVADLLTEADGRIRFGNLGLHPPAAVLPGRPVTDADYRRALLDTIAEIANVWVSAETDPARGIPGLYRISIKHASDETGPAEDAEVRESVREVYRANRNLCEDLAEVSSVERIEIDLFGEFEIGGARPPADILAEIYDQCARVVAASVVFQSFEQALAGKVPLEHILQPLHTRHGILRDEDLARADRQELFVGDLISKVKAIEGVRFVRHLSLARPGEEPTVASMRWNSLVEAPMLRFPGEDAFARNVRITRGGVDVRVAAREVRAKYRDLRAVDRSRAFARQDIAVLKPPPKGVYRKLDRYSSVQNHFPAIYGIDERGLPDSVSPLRKAQARQLKGFLTLFDQVLANGAEQLHHLRDLYSTRTDLQQSYWSQQLDAEAVPGIEALFARPDAQRDGVSAQFSTTDPYLDRRSRVLDHLLALHGEVFAQNTLRQFLTYCDAQERDERLVANKLAFVRSILKLGRDRASGFDYSRPLWPDADGKPGTPCGLHLRAGLLLGMEPVVPGPLTTALSVLGLEPVADDASAGTPHGGALIDDNVVDEGFQRVTPEPAGDPVSLDELRRTHRLSLGRDGGLSETLLRQGIDPGRYRVGQARGREDFALVFLPEGSTRWWVLGRYANAAAGVRAANRLRRFLMAVSRESEGMHLVEHVLLRPEGNDAAARSLARLPSWFFGLRLTVVLPGWTARGGEPAFRRFAEETIQLNTPAHVQPDCIWLGFRAMEEFEGLYRKWLDAKAASCETGKDHGSPAHALQCADLDRCSLAVAEFLLRHPPQSAPEFGS